MSLIRKHGAVLQAWACLALVLCGCFVFLTQDKFDIVQFIPTQIKFLATPVPTTTQSALRVREYCVSAPAITTFLHGVHRETCNSSLLHAASTCAELTSRPAALGQR